MTHGPREGSLAGGAPGDGHGLQEARLLLCGWGGAPPGTRGTEPSQKHKVPELILMATGRQGKQEGTGSDAHTHLPRGGLLPTALGCLLTATPVPSGRVTSLPRTQQLAPVCVPRRRELPQGLPAGE